MFSKLNMHIAQNIYLTDALKQLCQQYFMFKISMGDWSHVAFKSLKLLRKAEMENLKKLENPDGTNYMAELKKIGKRSPN